MGLDASVGGRDLAPYRGTSLAQTPPFVEVPTFPNATCPIMGKKVSLPLFVDTELGRIYVCCKPCFKKIRANVPVAHKTAYPVVEELVDMIETQRAYEVNSKMISATDDMLKYVNQNLS